MTKRLPDAIEILRAMKWNCHFERSEKSHGLAEIPPFGRNDRFGSFAHAAAMSIRQKKGYSMRLEFYAR